MGSVILVGVCGGRVRGQGSVKAVTGSRLRLVLDTERARPRTSHWMRYQHPGPTTFEALFVRVFSRLNSSMRRALNSCVVDSFHDFGDLVPSSAAWPPDLC